MDRVLSLFGIALYLVAAFVVVSAKTQFSSENVVHLTKKDFTEKVRRSCQYELYVKCVGRRAMGSSGLSSSMLLGVVRDMKRCLVMHEAIVTRRSL